MNKKIDIPFGMSEFQIKNFILSKESPHRVVRSCMIQIRQKQIALSECEIRQKRRDVDRREKEKELETATGFAKERLEIDLEEIKNGAAYEEKMIVDCIEELKVYETILNALPKYNRQEFESAELEYWTKRFIEDAKRELISCGTVKTDTIKSLENVGITVGKNSESKLTLSNSKFLE